MDPYRSPAPPASSAALPARRWGATLLGRLAVRLFRAQLLEQHAEGRAWRKYVRARIRYEDEIAEWRAKASVSPRFSAAIPEPLRPLPPPAYVRE